MTAGMLLSQDSANSLTWAMAHEVAHGIAAHAEEQSSWRMNIAGAVFRGLALTGMSLVPAVMLGQIVTNLAWWVLVHFCLAQEQEHEADVLGAAISKASGCRTDDVIATIARLHMDDLAYNHHFIARFQRKAVAALRQRLPNIHVPESPIEDSASLTALVASVQGNQSLVSFFGRSH